jgi:uncharacterized membrane protein YebE (DUF533 family)
MKISTLIASIALALTANAFAQAPADPAATPRIDQRQANQQNRINQGVASGQLTPREQAHMQKRQNHIASDKAAAKSDGVVTKQERAHIRHEQNRASKRIHKQKHDRQHTMPAAKG